MREGGGETKAKKGNRLGRTTLLSAIRSDLKAASGRDDLKYDAAPEIASRTAHDVPIEERAGYPIVLAEGSVQPKDWVTAQGVKIMVDFSRPAWMPDDWGQGVKTTQRISRSVKGSGGTLTSFVSPDGKVFYHKKSCERYAGRKFAANEGFQGQVRRARLQSQQAIQLARLQIRNASASAPAPEVVDEDASFFQLLSAEERRSLPDISEFHFAVVSARRAAKIEGVRDIWMVQSQFLEAGATPTWYVDETSLQDYLALGLRALVGGKLTAARNKALDDAQAQGKVCVQCSDDISAWEYREGVRTAVRTDDAMNAAHAAATRYVISPVAAARFVLAKMRSSEEPRPRLGGVYPLGSCARTFAGDAFSRKHFVIGDFFIAEGSSVRFDEEMRLKEDYDFTCTHLHRHGAVLRCNRLTLSVKHYSNCGGACTNRDQKGAEEKRNIAILRRKWPGVFRANPKRANEVIMCWKKGSALARGPADDDEADVGEVDEVEGTADGEDDSARLRTPEPKNRRTCRSSQLSTTPDDCALREACGRPEDAPAGRCSMRHISVGDNAILEKASPLPTLQRRTLRLRLKRGGAKHVCADEQAFDLLQLPAC